MQNGVPSTLGGSRDEEIGYAWCSVMAVISQLLLDFDRALLPPG